MAAIWVIILLAILQGVLEWLPVSSEGWLILTLNWLNEPENALAIALFLHLGTMVAVIIRFRKDFVLLFNYKIWKAKRSQRDENTETGVESIYNDSDNELNTKAYEQKILWKFLLLATLATAVIGIPIYVLLKFVLAESAFYFAGGAISGGDIITMVIGLLLIGTGILILVARKRTTQKTLFQMKNWEMLIVGAIQGLTILPGVSRSGTTVSTLLIEGVEDEDALRGSFLLSVPAILGANILTVIIDLIQGEFSLAGIPWYAMIIAFLLSGIIGYLTIDFFLWVARKLNFGWFCISVGILAVVITLIFIILSLVSIG
ncbi:MAG: undecaprenyl-diphosphate phosphatase [Candidatus Thorarchaeota archaeon]